MVISQQLLLQSVLDGARANPTLAPGDGKVSPWTSRQSPVLTAAPIRLLKVRTNSDGLVAFASVLLSSWHLASSTPVTHQSLQLCSLKIWSFSYQKMDVPPVCAPQPCISIISRVVFTAWALPENVFKLQWQIMCSYIYIYTCKRKAWPLHAKTAGSASK